MDIQEFYGAALTVGFFVCFTLGFAVARFSW
jgi:hypothetical protein